MTLAENILMAILGIVIAGIFVLSIPFISALMDKWFTRYEKWASGAIRRFLE